MGLRNTFSNSAIDIIRNNVTYVETINGLPSPVGGEIKVEDLKRYIITQPLNTLTNKIVPATAGAQVSIVSANEITNTLTTDLTGNEPLFSGDFGRLVIQDLNIVSSTGTSKLFDIKSVTATRPVVIHERSVVTSFQSIGSIDGAFTIATNAVFVLCGEGVLLNNNGANFFGTGILWDKTNFVAQGGNHITVAGTSNFVSIRTTFGEPAMGDKMFDLSGLTVTGALDISGTLFSDANGGTLGLTQEVSADTTLSNVYKDILVDTTLAQVEITLPDITSGTFSDGYIIDITDAGNASTNSINIIPNALDGTTINNGLSQYNITENGGSVVLELNGSSWEILNRFNQKSIISVNSTSILSEIADVILGDTSGGEFATTLPTAVGRRGKFAVLKKLQGNQPRWTILPNGSETIDNSSELRLNGSSGRAATLMSDGLNWLIIEAA